VFEREQAQYDKQYAAWKRGSGKTVDVMPTKPEPPHFQQLFSTDATVEALGEVLAHNPRGTLFVRDELTGWARAMNQYKGGKGADRQTWLSFWNGATAVINRKSRKEPLVLEHPFVGVTGCLPPDVLGELADERGREDGFIHRILFSSPSLAPVVWTDDCLPQKTQDQYAAVLDALYKVHGDESDRERPRVLPLTRKGKAAFVEWATSHYEELGAPDFAPTLRGPWAKMEGYCARLALVLHLARFVCQETKHTTVDDISVFGAAALIDYFKNHARLVYAQLQASPEEKRLDAARQWIARHGGEVTLRDLYRHKVAGCKTPTDAEHLLDLLVGHGYGTRTDEMPPTGGHR
jgi:hypothetical protein